MDVFAPYIVPLLFIYFAWRFLKRPAPFGDNEGFATKRAKDSEEIWNFVQRTAGLYCLAAGIALALLSYYISTLDEAAQSSLLWLRIGVQIAGIALLFPAVTIATNFKFPKK